MKGFHVSENDETTDGPETPLEEGQKKVEVEASATVSDESGATHEVDVKAEATVTDIRERQEGEKESICAGCGQSLYNNRCANADCDVAVSQASKGAVEETAKVAVGSAPVAGRQHFARSGNVD